MSELSQEPRIQSRFRLARVTAPGAGTPPLARLVPIAATLEPVNPDTEPMIPNPVAAVEPVEGAAIRAVVLETTGFTPEALEQAEALGEQERLAAPPAPIADPVKIRVELTAAAPHKGELRSDVRPKPFLTVPPSLPELELQTLRSRYVPGPNPNAQLAAAAPPPVAQPEKAQPEPPKQEVAQQEAPKPKITIRPAEPAKPVRTDVRRPSTMVARSGAVAVPKEEQEPPPAAVSATAKAPVIPIRKPEVVPDASPAPVSPAPPAPATAPAETSISLGLPSAGSSGAGMKIGITAAVVVVLAGAGWFAMSGGSNKPAGAPAAAVEVAEPLPPLGGAGWSSNWGAESPANRGKQISIYRPTMTTPDYRIELNAQIEKKALGWIFRAKDPKNYYVMKLEWIKPGPAPITALIKYAVINGKESTHTQVLLPFENLSLTTMYKIRTDVKGSTFTTWVNDKLVDSWTDDRVKLGGAGVYAEPGERSAIKTTNILALR